MLIVDGSRRRRSITRGAVEVDGAAEVVGEAGTAGEAVLLARALDPDGGPLRRRLPDVRAGGALCRELKDLADPPLVVLHDDREGHGQSGLAYLLSGADGYAPYAEESDPDDGPASNAP